MALVPYGAWATDVILRIPVTQEGVYRVTYNALGYYGQPYGIDPKNIDPRQIHIYNRNRDVAIYVYGDEDDKFGQGDYVEFYGIPVRPDDPEYKYTDENVYWFRVSTDQPVRMPTWESSGSGTPKPFFLHTYHAEKNWFYWETMPDGVGLDHWFWGRKILKGKGQDYTFYLSNIASTSQPATVRVYLHGRTDDSASPDHKTRITLNGTSLGDVVWDGQEPITYSFDDVSHSLLISDKNTIRFDEIENPDVTVDSIFVNWVEVDYYKKFIAEGNRLKFTAQGNGNMSFQISNFSSPTIEVFDVSDPYQPRRLTNPTVTSSDGIYTVKFSDTISGEATYLAIAMPEIKDISLNFITDPPTLKDTKNGADYIIITHDDLKEAVSPLVEHRRNNGYRVKVVTTQQIYDEFFGGIFTPHAIKDFIKYTYESWQPAPEFVLLVGDANLDYKDYWGTGQINHVPTYLVETTIAGETPSDHWYVTVTTDPETGIEDPLPDMFIGRIPAKTTSEVNAMVNKIIAYETDAKGDWLKRVMFAASDHSNEQNPLFNDPKFKGYSEEWITHLPSTYMPYRVYVGDYSDKAQSKVDFFNNLNNGVLITSFFGHGVVDLWAGGAGLNLFTSEDADSLVNQGKFPFVGFNCLNGLFAMPSEGTRFELPDGSPMLFSIPLPEALLFQDGRGALAMWSPSAFAYPSEQRWIGRELFSGLFDQGNNILGSVTTLAKVNAYIKKGIYVENLDVFTFFGDPATRLSLDIKKNNPSSGSGGGGCFIATAAYGSYLAHHVRILRDFRDRILLQNALGRWIVDRYYRLSPPLAAWISEHHWAKGAVRVMLLPFVFYAYIALITPLWMQIGLFFVVLTGATGIILRKRLLRLVLTLGIVLLFSGMITGPQAHASGIGEDVRLISADEWGLSVELILPSYGVEQTVLDQKVYDSIIVEDYGFSKEIGKPMLPVRGILIGVPEEGNISLTVTPGKFETRRLLIPPATLPNRNATSIYFDPEVYGKNAFYPGSPALKGFTGYMRDQKVMQILFYPVQYNPKTGEVRIYKNIKLKVDFDQPAKALSKTLPGGGRGDDYPSPTVPRAYEKFLKGLLLNYP